MINTRELPAELSDLPNGPPGHYGEIRNVDGRYYVRVEGPERWLERNPGEVYFMADVRHQATSRMHHI